MQVGQEIWLPQWLYDGLPRAAVVLAVLGMIFGPIDMVTWSMFVLAGCYGTAVLVSRSLTRGGDYGE